MKYEVREALSLFGIDFHHADEEFTVLCPFHTDTNPSAKINATTGQFYCFGCKTASNVIRYLARKFDKSIKEVYAVIARATSASTRIFQNPQDIEKWHVELFNHPKLLKELFRRGVDEQAVRLYRLGAFTYGDGHTSIRIPIYNARGEVVAIKDYNPGASTKYAWPNLECNKQRWKPRTEVKKKLCTALLFPVEQLVYDTIAICGGELKAVAAAKVLNPLNIGAISGTSSETDPWTDEQLLEFVGKKVYIIYDVDEAGVTGANRIGSKLLVHTKEVYVVELPLPKSEFPNGDVCDYLRNGGDLPKLLEDTPLYVPPPEMPTLDESEPPTECELDSAVLASNTGKRIKIRAVVSSKDTSAYSIPSQISTKCTRGAHNYCENCGIYKTFGSNENEVHLQKERIEIIEMVGQELFKQDRVLKRAFSIPPRCMSVVFTPLKHYNVEDVRISQQLDITSRSHERSMQIAYCIGEGQLDLNESYVMTGRMYPHPANQQAALLISDYEATQDALSTYHPTNLDHLHIFRPTEWTVESLTAKLDDIYADFEANVTRIFQRRNLHLTVDLAYHSPLWLQFDGKKEVKGWVEVLVIGDSAQGKSETVKTMLQHYSLGERIDAKGASVAGLLGGVQQFGKRWFITWGKIPTNDRRLVILEELKGTSVEVIAKLTDMRSSGIAAITKIVNRTTHARTRLIVISNPRSSGNIDSYNYGIDCIKELIGSPEDVRRFDMALLLSAKEVDTATLSRMRPVVEHKFTSELCRELILYAWTVPNVVFEDEKFVIDKAVELCGLFVDDVPIVDRTSMREKLARLSAALAARTFSTLNDETLLVRNCHVEYIAKFLETTYSSTYFGYREYSKKMLTAEQLTKPDTLKKAILTTPYPEEFVEALLSTEEIDMQFIQDTLGWQMNDARNLIAALNRCHAIKRHDRIYRKTAEFTAFLKSLVIKADENRPKYVEERF